MWILFVILEETQGQIAGDIPALSGDEKAKLLEESKSAFYKRRRVEINGLPKGISKDVS